MNNKNDFQVFMQLCLKALSRREYSRVELMAKAKNIDSTVVNSVLDNLITQGWQSDTRFCEQYVRARMEKGDGPLKIRYALQMRGVDDTTIADALASVDWCQRALIVYAKKYPNKTHSASERAKRQKFLMQRGFTFDNIKVAMYS